jgi:beta-phosphoglucomutase
MGQSRLKEAGLGMVRGAIFDMDGVIVDNVVQHLRAWKELGRELQREFGDDQIKPLFGKRNREILEGLLGPRQEQSDLARWGARKEELYREIMKPELRAVPGLPRFLDRLRGAAIKTAVATSGPIENVKFVLEGLGLEASFGVLVTGSDAPLSKPDPGIFLVAAQRLQVNASSCVVFEDSPPGIKAAQAAGAFCIALATTHSRQELEDYQPDRIIEDFNELGVGDLTIPRIRSSS